MKASLVTILLFLFISAVHAESPNSGTTNKNGDVICFPTVTGTISGTACIDPPVQIFPDQSISIAIAGTTYSCLPDEETVMRHDFKVGCAKDVHDQRWH